MTNKGTFQYPFFLSVYNQHVKVNHFLEFLITQSGESLTIKFPLDQFWVMWILMDHSWLSKIQLHEHFGILWFLQELLLKCLVN